MFRLLMWFLVKVGVCEEYNITTMGEQFTAYAKKRRKR